MNRSFPLNPRIQSMDYSGELLTLRFFKTVAGKLQVESRTYGPVPVQLAYGLYYTITAGESLSFYAKHIRKKFTLIKKTITI